MRQISLRTRIFGVTIGVAAVTFALAFSLITWIAREQAQTSALEAATAMASEYGESAEKEFVRTYTTVNSLTLSLLAMKRAQQPDRVLAQEVAKSLLAANTQLIGLSSYWEPNAFDGKDAEWVDQPGHDRSGRLMAYWNRASGSIAVDVTVDYEDEAKSPWYFVPKKTGKFYITEPYVYPISGKDVLMVSLMSPILVDGRFAGVSGSDYPLSTLQKILSELKPYGTGSVALISQGGVYASHPDEKSLNQPVADVPAEVMAQVKAGKAARYIDANGMVNVFQPVRIGLSDIYWSLKVSFPLAAVMSGANRIMTVSIALAIASVVFMALLMLPLLRRMTQSIVRLTTTMRELAAGQGDLTQQLPVTSGDEIGQISSAFNAFIGKLRELVGEVATQSSRLDEAALALATNSRGVAARSNQQVDESSATAAAMQQIAVSIAHVAESAGDARVSVDDANRLTQSAHQRLDETVREIGGINDSMRAVAQLVEGLDGRARDIGSITDVIKDIAGQTNLLALNAAIEAARAGEQGRGFAVVADEVRKLAERTTQATADISDKLAAIQQETSHAVKCVADSVEQVDRGVVMSHSAAESIEGIHQASIRLVDQVGEIASAAQQQKMAGNDIAGRLERISNAAQENDNALQQNVESSSQLKAMADNLQGLVHRFRV